MSTVEQAVIENGEVAICQTLGTASQITWSTGTRIFEIRYGVSLIWIKPTEVDEVLKIKTGCCGNSRQTFRLATSQEVARWKTGQA